MEDNNTLHSTPNNKEIVLRTENLVDHIILYDHRIG